MKFVLACLLHTSAVVAQMACDHVKESYLAQNCCNGKPFKVPDVHKRACACPLAEEASVSEQTQLFTLFRYKGLTPAEVDAHFARIDNYPELSINNKKKFGGAQSFFNKEKTELLLLIRFNWAEATIPNFMTEFSRDPPGVPPNPLPISKLVEVHNLWPPGMLEDPNAQETQEVLKTFPFELYTYNMTVVGLSPHPYSANKKMSIIFGYGVRANDMFYKPWIQEYLQAEAIFQGYDSEHSNELQIVFHNEDPMIKASAAEMEYKDGLIVDVFSKYPDYVRPNGFFAITINGNPENDSPLINPAQLMHMQSREGDRGWM